MPCGALSYGAFSLDVVELDGAVLLLRWPLADLAYFWGIFGVHVGMNTDMKAVCQGGDKAMA